MSRVVELFYTVGELAFLLRLGESTVSRKWKSGEFSPAGPDGQPDISNIVDLGGDIRIPASGVNHYLDRHRVRRTSGVAARTVGELRRKVGQLEVSSG